MINRLMIFALPVLMLAACTREDVTARQEIALTTPVIELSAVQASTRAAVGSSTVSNARVFLSLHDSEDREVDQDRLGEYEFNGSSWTHTMAPTVTGGKGYYRAGIQAVIDLKATGSMPAIINAVYAHRGSINVEADGTFAPTAELEPLTSAVLVVLKNANGETISSSTSGGKYRIYPQTFEYLFGFGEGSDGQYYPFGTADPEYMAYSQPSFNLTDTAIGDYFPSTYFDDQNGGPIFKITYCAEGFVGDIPKGSKTTEWIVNYPAGRSLTMEAGKLYTFTITLGKDAHITLDTENAVTVDSWVPGSQISVGK